MEKLQHFFHESKRIAKKANKKVLKSNKFTKKLYMSNLNRTRERVYHKQCESTPIDEKMIIFESFMGRSYADSPREIYEYLYRHPDFKDYTFVWCFTDVKSKRGISQLQNAMLVTYHSMLYYELYSQAKYIVSNSRIDTIIAKRPEQIYIQTWHGTPLKRLGYDIPKGDNARHSQEELCELYKLDAVRYNYLLSPSAFVTEKLTSAFNLPENNPAVDIVEEGYPRNDILSTFTDYDVYYAKKTLAIEKINKKVILYAPTWRDNQYEEGVGYKFDLPIDFDRLQEALKDEYIILFRAHYFVANAFDFSKYNGFIYNVSKYENINDLYIAADILITDYSSVFFDYAILKRPMLFYMYDLKDYQEEIRGFYISLDDLPGPIVQTEEELIKAVKTDFVYDETYKKFNERFNALEDGKATERAVKRIFK